MLEAERELWFPCMYTMRRKYRFYAPLMHYYILSTYNVCTHILLHVHYYTCPCGAKCISLCMYNIHLLFAWIDIYMYLFSVQFFSFRVWMHSYMDIHVYVHVCTALCAGFNRWFFHASVTYCHTLINVLRFVYMYI